jgi:hypothetical protein
MTRLSLGGLCSCSALGCAIAAAGPEPSLATRSPVATPIDVAAVRAMSVVDGRRLLLVVGDDPLELWTLRVQPGGEGSTVQTRVPLRDPDGRIPWTLLHELAGPRVLTRFDVDVASLLEAPDGTLWMGDLLGPFVLHFDGDGRLLDPPWPLPRFGEPGQLRAPDNPARARARARPDRLEPSSAARRRRSAHGAGVARLAPRGVGPGVERDLLARPSAGRWISRRSVDGQRALAHA